MHVTRQEVDTHIGPRLAAVHGVVGATEVGVVLAGGDGDEGAIEVRCRVDEPIASTVPI